MKTLALLLAAGVTLSALASTHAQDAPAFAADVSESVTTPDIVEIYSIGTRNFFGGMPSPDTVEKLYDNLDLIQRNHGVSRWHSGRRHSGLRQRIRGHRPGAQPGQHDRNADGRALHLADAQYHDDLFYLASIVDTLSRPVVIKVPPGILAPMDDAEFTYVADFGPLGPDEGKGVLAAPAGLRGGRARGLLTSFAPRPTATGSSGACRRTRTGTPRPP